MVRRWPRPPLSLLLDLSAHTTYRVVDLVVRLLVTLVRRLVAVVESASSFFFFFFLDPWSWWCGWCFWWW